MYIGETPGCGCDQVAGLGLFPLIAPGITAAATIASALFGKGKPQHMSAWGFHVDDFSAHILQAEGQIKQLRDLIAQTLKQPPPQYPMSPWPPATPGPVGSGGKGLQAWYDAMRPVVAQYSSQADCVTNKNQVAPGGCYEQAYGTQLALIQQLTQQLQQAQAQAATVPQVPGATTVFNPNLPAPVAAAPFMQQPGMLPMLPGAPSQAMPTPSLYGPSPSMPQFMPSPYAPGGAGPITITTPGSSGYSGPGVPQIFAGDMTNYLIMGALGIGLVMILTAPKGSQSSGSSPKRRATRKVK